MKKRGESRILKIWTEKLVVLSTVLLFLGISSFVSAYDDFTGPLMDDQKWRQPEYVREAVNGKLLLKVANAVNLSYTPRVSNNVINPSSVHSIECFITVAGTSSTDTGDNAESAGRIEGFFYNTQAAGGATGDVWAAVKIGNRGSGLEAWWEISESLNDGLTEFNLVSSNTIIPIGTLSYDTAYQAKISYDGERGFTFEVNGWSDSYSGPERQRNAVTGFKAISAMAYGTAGDGYTSILVDDVFINSDATVYDDFSASDLDPTKWGIFEKVLEIANGKARLNIQTKDFANEIALNFQNHNTDYLEAKVLVESGSTMSPGAYGKIRLGGYYHNITGVYEGHKDDVWVELRITLNDNGYLVPNCFMWRSTNTDESQGETLFSYDFTTPISFDTEYTLSIEKTGEQFTFSLNDESTSYTVTTPMYEPSIGQYREIRSRVYADPGETGYLKTTIDDVLTSKESSTPNLTQAQVARLYVATFNRAPLQAGLDYWVYSSGLAIENIAKSFFDQPEAQALYPAGTSNTDFVKAIYQNLFNRDPLPAGLDYWTGPDGLGGSITRDVMILAVINGAVGTDAEKMVNKTEVGLYYAASGLPGKDFSLADVTDDDATVVARKAAIASLSAGSCGAYVAPGVWKEFDCYNLAAIGKTTSDDPFTPSWRLNGGYWQWGRKGPDSSQWYTANTANFAHGPTGPGAGEANSGSINEWDQTYAPNGAWYDASKTANDPCPSGYRVPTKAQWDGVRTNNTQSVVGTWSTYVYDYTNFSSARFFGDDLMLPAAGSRNDSDGSLYGRSNDGIYWSSTEGTSNYAWSLYFNSSAAITHNHFRQGGFSVRCVAE